MLFRLAALAAVLGALFVGCEQKKSETSKGEAPVAEGKAASKPKVIRVMNYNIHHGRGRDEKVNIERTAQVIIDQKADLVALEEVDRGVERTDRRDLPAELAKLTGMEVYFAKNIEFQGGDYGNAILSRFPILVRTNTHYHMIRPKEQRGLLQAVVDIEGRQVLMMATHIDWRVEDDERVLNIVEMKNALTNYPGLPAFLAGDFNDHPNTRVHNGLKEAFHDAWETVGEGDGITHVFPTDGRTQRIDYIFYSKHESIRPLRCWVVDSDASDHRAVMAEFELK